MRSVLLLVCCALCLTAQTDSAPAEKGVIAGKVLNSATGEPIRKAHVSLLGLSPRSLKGGTAFTDAAGRFEFTALAPGQYLLLSSHDGFVPPNDRGKLKEQRVVLASAEEKRDLLIRLTPFGVVTGRLVDEDGDPIRGTEVQIMTYEYSAGGRQLSPRGNARSDDRGQYRIFDVAPGRYYLRAGSLQMVGGTDEAFAPSYYPGTPDAAGASAIDVAAGQEASIDMTLHLGRLARIRGRVMNRANDLEVGLSVSRGGGSSTTTNSVDDPAGKFELLGVSPGAYTLFAKGTIAGQHCSAHMLVQVAAADLDGIELHLLPPIEIAGQIRVEGQSATPLPRLRAVLESEGHESVSPETRDDGTFTIQGLAPGIYQFSAAAPDDLYLKAVRWAGRDVLPSGLDLSQGVAGGALLVLLSANGARLNGTVENDQSAPVSGATVALVPADPHRKSQFKFAESNRDGHFNMHGIAPGSYRIFAFEDADPHRVLYDPDFLRPYDSQAQTLDLDENARQTVRLTLIPQPSGNDHNRP